MNEPSLGNFEELVLLIVGVLDENAYGVSIKNELAERTGRSPSIGALHSALNRLENKGFLESFEGGATAERGGRRKRYYRITALGKRGLIQVHALRNELIQLIPHLSLGGN